MMSSDMSPDARDAADGDIQMGGAGTSAASTVEPAALGRRADYISDIGPSEEEERSPKTSSDPPHSFTEYVDWAFEMTDGSGRFQKVYTAMLSVPWAICGAQTMAHIFTTLPSAKTMYAQRSEAETCNVPYYEHADKTRSVIAYWKLVCEDEFLVPLLGTFFFLGFLVGVTWIGSLADTRGRKRAFLWSIVLLQTGAFIATMAPFYIVYAFGRFLTGLGVGGMGLSSYVLNNELVGPEMRPLLMLTSNCCFALGSFAVSPLSLLVVEWRSFHFLLWVLGLPLLCMYGWMVESPKWLASQQKPVEMYTLMCDIAQFNRRRAPPVPPAMRKGLDPDLFTDKPKPASTEQASVIKQMCCDPRLALRFHACCVAWFALSLGYYGLSLNVGHMGMEIHKSSAMASLVELPAYFIAFWAVDAPQVGRRGATAGGLVFGGLCCVLSALFAGDAGAKPGMFIVALAFIGKSGIALSFSTVYLYSAELFPTSLRSRAMGLQSLMARVAGMMAPIVADLGKHSSALPMFIFGAPCVVAGLLLLTLPETRGKPMTDSIEDLPAGGGAGICPCLMRYAHLADEPKTPGGV